MKILEKMFSQDGKDLTILLVSHDEAFIAACCDTVWRLERNGNSGYMIL